MLGFVALLASAFLLFKIYGEIEESGYVSQKEKACIESGGKVVYITCYCKTKDFPNTCSIGYCTCQPWEPGYKIKICDCGPDKCFDGEKCVDREEYYSGVIGSKPPENFTEFVKEVIREKLPDPKFVTKSEEYYLGCNITIFATHIWPHNIAGPSIETMFFGILSCPSNVSDLNIESFKNELIQAKREKHPEIKSEILVINSTKVIHNYYFAQVKKDEYHFSQILYEEYIFKLNKNYIVCSYRDEGLVEEINLERFKEVVHAIANETSTIKEDPRYIA